LLSKPKTHNITDFMVRVVRILFHLADVQGYVYMAMHVDTTFC